MVDPSTMPYPSNGTTDKDTLTYRCLGRRRKKQEIIPPHPRRPQDYPFASTPRKYGKDVKQPADPDANPPLNTNGKVH